MRGDRVDLQRGLGLELRWLDREPDGEHLEAWNCSVQLGRVVGWERGLRNDQAYEVDGKPGYGGVFES